jgi:hypothetical protein
MAVAKNLKRMAHEWHMTAGKVSQINVLGSLKNTLIT